MRRGLPRAAWTKPDELVEIGPGRGGDDSWREDGVLPGSAPAVPNAQGRRGASITACMGRSDPSIVAATGCAAKWPR